MKWAKVAMTLFAVAVFGVAFVAGASAQVWNQKSVVTFNQPVEIPGRALPAGTYTFKLLDAAFNRNVVQVFNADETQLIATVLAINNYTLKPTGKTMMMFEERPADTPPALKAWFYPNHSWGQEFVYPKVRAVQLAQVTKEPIPAVESVPGKVEELKSEAIVVETPEKTEVAVAEFPPFMPHETGNLTAPPLPGTASPVPMIALFGIVAVSVGLMLRRFA